MPSTTTSAGGDDAGGDEKSKNTPVAAKTIGFLVVFGIASSIAKALLTKPNPHPQRPRGPRMGFSNVSVDAIREANGISGNKIYAGKKLIIP
ncbi:hypothetical protein C4D60_Mb04t08040 [Musa balbisiana]|uniref:LysM domain-containing protein n=1 Tax=Musa balbisiana TaxID=52838 RepID=A0A4S8KAI4_MUSBA|nr:hypothetical protein C4D60_Mb04t08040 [Musa balbisiana]